MGWTSRSTSPTRVNCGEKRRKAVRCGRGIGQGRGKKCVSESAGTEQPQVEEVRGAGARRTSATSPDEPPGLIDLESIDPWAKCFTPASEHDMAWARRHESTSTAHAKPCVICTRAFDGSAQW